jgi:hypothetical protein
MIAKLDFLTSRKFWALVVIGIISICKGMEVIGADIADPLTVFLYGFIGVNVVTKAIDKIGA